MKISNKTYDYIKWFTITFIPAFELFILSLGKIWGIPYYSEIGASVAALGVFLAALIGVSSNTYKKNLQQIATDEAIAQDGNQGEEMEGFDATD